MNNDSESAFFGCVPEWIRIDRDPIYVGDCYATTERDERQWDKLKRKLKDRENELEMLRR